DLAQVFVQRAAQVGQVVVAGFQLQRQRPGFRGAVRRFLWGMRVPGVVRRAHSPTRVVSVVTISPRRVLARASVMRTSTICPIRRGWPAKLTMRLFSVRPFMSLGSFFEGPSTSR